MSEVTDRSIVSFVNWLAARARSESLPIPRTSTRVMARIRESSDEPVQDRDIGSPAKADFQSILAAHLKKRG